MLKPLGSTAGTVPPEAGPALPPASPENIEFWRMTVATAQLVQGLLLGKVNTNLWQAAFLSFSGGSFSGPRDGHVVSSAQQARVAAYIDGQMPTRLAVTRTINVSTDGLTDANSQGMYNVMALAERPFLVASMRLGTAPSSADNFYNFLRSAMDACTLLLFGSSVWSGPAGEIREDHWATYNLFVVVSDSSSVMRLLRWHPTPFWWLTGAPLTPSVYWTTMRS